MFDLFNFGGSEFRRSITGAGSNLPAFGNPKPITEKAFVVDYMGEVEYTVDGANEGEKEGWLLYLGCTTNGHIVEHRWLFQ